MVMIMFAFVGQLVSKEEVKDNLLWICIALYVYDNCRHS